MSEVFIDPAEEPGWDSKDYWIEYWKDRYRDVARRQMMFESFMMTNLDLTVEEFLSKWDAYVGSEEYKRDSA